MGSGTAPSKPERTFRQRVWAPEKRGWTEVEHRTTPATRRFLIGMDERHLFIAQLTAAATSVREAHQRLQPAVGGAVGDRGSRQALRAGAEPPHRRPMRGRPHLASERVAIGDREFVRGHVRHPDHKVLVLKDWMRVAMNTEERGEARSQSLAWFD